MYKSIINFFSIIEEQQQAQACQNSSHNTSNFTADTSYAQSKASLLSQGSRAEHSQTQSLHSQQQSQPSQSQPNSGHGSLNATQLSSGSQSHMAQPSFHASGAASVHTSPHHRAHSAQFASEHGTPYRDVSGNFRENYRLG